MDDDKQPLLDCIEALAKTPDTRLNQHIREDVQAALLVPGATLTLFRAMAVQDRRLARLEEENEDLRKTIARIESTIREANP